MVDEQYLTAIYNEIHRSAKNSQKCDLYPGRRFNIPDVDWQNLTVRAGDQYPLRVSQDPVVQS